jgi:hypothetical protein
MLTWAHGLDGAEACERLQSRHYHTNMVLLHHIHQWVGRAKALVIGDQDIHREISKLD